MGVIVVVSTVRVPVTDAAIRWSVTGHRTFSLVMSARFAAEVPAIENVKSTGVSLVTVVCVKTNVKESPLAAI